MSLNDFLAGKEVQTENGSVARVTRKTPTEVMGTVTHGKITLPTSWSYYGKNFEFPGWHISSKEEEEKEEKLESSTPTPAQPYICASVTGKVGSIDISGEYSMKFISSMKETKLNQLKESLKWFMDNDISYLVSNLPLSTDEETIEVSYQSTANRFDKTRKLIIELEELYFSEDRDEE